VLKAISAYKIKAVIDFSCYEYDDAVRGAKPFPADTRYIYISSDSVYNANGLFVDTYGEQGPPSELEMYSVYDKHEGGIPEDVVHFRQSKYLRKLDSYGYYKLKCEDYLQ